MARLTLFVLLAVAIGVASAVPGKSIRCQSPIDIGDTSVFTAPAVVYGYDDCRNTCVKFLFTGVGGNENRFNSLEDCQINCIDAPVPAKS